MARLLLWLRGQIGPMWRRPFYTLTFLAVSGSSIGASLAAFNLLNAILLEPLPFPQPDRLIAFQKETHAEPSAWSYPFFEVFAGETTSFSEIGLYKRRDFFLSGSHEPRKLIGVAVTPSALRALGVFPERGALFPSGVHSVLDDTILVSHGFWIETLGGAPDVVGRRVILNGRAALVSGVMPAGFDFPDSATEIWAPLGFDMSSLLERDSAKVFHPIARLKDNLRARQAEQEALETLKWINAGLAASSRHAGLRLVPLRSQLLADVAPNVLGNELGASLSRVCGALGGAAFLVLLAAASNLVSLALVRSDARRAEINVRVALGGSRPRLVGLLVGENLVLAVSGALIGLAVQVWLRAAFAGLVPDQLAIRSLELSGGLLAVLAVGLGIMLGLACGLVQAHHLRLLRRGQSATPIRNGGPPPKILFREIMVTAQLAAALALLAPAGLLGTGYLRMTGLHLDGDISQLSAVTVELPPTKRSSPEMVSEAFNSFLESLREVPGAASVAAASLLPFERTGVSSIYSLDGAAEPQDTFVAPCVAVTPGYFNTLGLEIVQGRDFDNSDGIRSIPVAVLDTATAQVLWPGQDPIGKQLKEGFPQEPGSRLTVVGVVSSPLEKPTKPHPNWSPLAEVYVPAAQQPSIRMHFLIRGDRSSDDLSQAVRGAFWRVSPEQPVAGPRSFPELFQEALRRPRLHSRILVFFAVAALFFSAVGTYGILRFVLSQRERDLAILLALGARPKHVTRFALAPIFRAVAASFLVGGLGAVVFGRYLATLFAEVNPNDARVYLAVIAILLLSIAVASLGPLSVGYRLSPAEVLRNE